MCLTWHCSELRRAHHTHWNQLDLHSLRVNHCGHCLSVCILCIWDWVSLCYPSWPRTHNPISAGLSGMCCLSPVAVTVFPSQSRGQTQNAGAPPCAPPPLRRRALCELMLSVCVCKQWQLWKRFSTITVIGWDSRFARGYYWHRMENAFFQCIFVMVMLFMWTENDSLNIHTGREMVFSSWSGELLKVSERCILLRVRQVSCSYYRLRTSAHSGFDRIGSQYSLSSCVRVDGAFPPSSMCPSLYAEGREE